jgi:hypothetical protein
MIERAVTIERIYAYYGGIVSAWDGATAHFHNNTNAYFLESFEGSIAYLQRRARFVANNRVTFTSLYSRKGAAIFSSNGCQFWLDDVEITNCKAGY